MNFILLLITIVLVIAVISLVLANILLIISKSNWKGEKNDKN